MTDVMTDEKLVEKSQHVISAMPNDTVCYALRVMAPQQDTSQKEQVILQAATRIQSLTADLERAKEALRPFAFMDMGKDEDEGVALTTQDVWETIYGNRVKDWFDYDAIDKARQTLKDITHD